MCSTGDKDLTQVNDVHLDILKTEQIKQMETLDEIEGKLQMASGSLKFAADHANGYEDFYIGVDSHIQEAMLLLNSLRK